MLFLNKTLEDYTEKVKLDLMFPSVIIIIQISMIKNN